MYFRLDDNRFYVPVSLLVPGSQIPFVKGGDKDKATLDIIGAVVDEVKRPIGRARADRQAQSRSVAQRAAEKHSVHHQLQSAARQVHAQICGARKPDRPHGLVRRRHHAARSEEGAAQDELHRAGLHAPAEQGQQMTRWCATARSTCPTSATSSARISTCICSTRSTIPRTRSRPKASPKEPKARASTCSAAWS